MDSKLLCLSLLIAALCLWCVEAGSLEEVDEKYKYDDVEYDRTTDDTRAAINAHAAETAAVTAQKMANNAKTTEESSRFYKAIARSLLYFFEVYRKFTEDTKLKAREAYQNSLSDRSRIGPHSSKEREWNTQAREARTMVDTLERQIQTALTKANEERRESIVAYSQASMYEAQAFGNSKKAEVARGMSRELKRLGEIIRQVAGSYHMRGVEMRNQATAEKVKAEQQAQNSQKHLAAAKAYEQEALATRMSSRANAYKSIENNVMAERQRNMQKLDLLRSDMEAKYYQECSAMAEQDAAMHKILVGEAKLARSRAKRDETKAYEYSQSRRMMGSQMADASEMLSLAQAKDDSYEEDSQVYRFNNHNAEDAVKGSPSEDKRPLYVSDEGLN